MAVKPFPSQSRARLVAPGFVLLSAFLGASQASLANVVTNVSCQLGTNTPTVGTSSCALGTPGTLFAQASSQFSDNYGANGVNTLTVSQSLSVHGLYVGTSYTPAKASSLVSGVVALRTSGPVRAGFVQGSFTPISNGAIVTAPYGGQGGVTVSLLNVPGTNSNLSITCPFNNSSCQNSSMFGLPNTLVPVTLGFGFGASVLSDPSIFADPNTFATSGSIGGVFTFRFFESDGMTPVPVTPTPEPSPLALLGVAGVSMAALAWLRRLKVALRFS